MATAFPVRREDIVKHIKGQTLRLPELEGLFNGWPRLINPHQAAVEDVTRDVIHKYTVSQKLLKKLEKIKLASLVTVFYPFASPERLTELVYFVCWMFILDDEIDTMTAAGRDSDAEFRRIWDECLRVIGESCGLHGQEPETGWRKSDFDSVESFRGIGRWLTARYTVEQRQRFWDETLRTAHSYSKEQKIRRAMGVPDYDDYCEYRYGSCCMGQAFTMVEYANESSLPAEVMDSPEVRALCVETARLLWINNDIISVKKEIADDFLENLVVIASKPKYHLQDGMDHCIEKLKGAVKAADQAASTLRAKYVTGRNDNVARELDKLITTCQSMSAGLFFWTRDSPRYGFLHEPRDADGTATFTVGEPPL